MPAETEISPALGALILEKLDDVTRRLDAMKLPEQPGLTVRAFAKRAGISVNTAFRRIAAGEIAKKNGKVPFSELRKFLS